MNDFNQRFAYKIPWVMFRNDSGQTIPPYSVIAAVEWFCPDPSSPLSGNSLSPFFIGVQPATQYSGSAPPSSLINPHEIYITGDVATPPATGQGPNGVAARPIEYPQLVRLYGPVSDPSDAPLRMLGAQPQDFRTFRDVPGFLMLASPVNGLVLVLLSKGPYRGILPVSSTNQGEITCTPILEPWNDTGPVPLSNAGQPIFNPYSSINTEQSGVSRRCTYDWVGSGNWELIAADPCPDSSGGGLYGV
jgi:hypothetical protein